MHESHNLLNLILSFDEHENQTKAACIFRRKNFVMYIVAKQKQATMKCEVQLAIVFEYACMTACSNGQPSNAHKLEVKGQRMASSNKGNGGIMEHPSLWDFITSFWIQITNSTQTTTGALTSNRIIITAVLLHNHYYTLLPYYYEG